MTAAFLDSNILAYAFGDDKLKRPPARDLLQSGFVISVQSLNEFANVARRKLRFDWADVREALLAIETLSVAIVPVTLSLHGKALALADRYRLSVYDGMIVAAALEAGCDTLWSEDMHHGLVVDRRLMIRNPFGA